jgi:hypothetical protein
VGHEDGDELEAIRSRLAAAEDRLAIMELEGAYAAAFDARHGALWASLFTEDGCYESRDGPAPAGQPANFVKGREALALFCDGAAFSGIHLLCPPDLRLDGDRATARVHFTFHAVHDDPLARATAGTLVGYYDVAYRRTADCWRIERRVTTTFSRRREWTAGYLPGSALE